MSRARGPGATTDRSGPFGIAENLLDPLVDHLFTEHWYQFFGGLLTYWCRKRYFSLRWPEQYMGLVSGMSLIGKPIIGDLVAVGTAIRMLAFTKIGGSPCSGCETGLPSRPFAFRSATATTPRFAPLRGHGIATARARRRAAASRHDPYANGLTASRMCSALRAAVVLFATLYFSRSVELRTGYICSILPWGLPI